MTPAPTPDALDVVCHHHEPDADLLLDAALPATRDAARLGVSAHVERHWLHGPHLRLRLCGPAELLNEAAESARRRFVDHLAAHPRTPTVDHAELLARSVAAGRAELVPGPYEPIHAHGTVLVERADDTALARLLGSAAAVEHRRQLMVHGLEPLAASARWLRSGDDPTARVKVALAAMTVHAGGYPPGLVAGCTSFISHIEDFLVIHDRDGQLRSRFEQVWLRTGDRVTDTMRAVADGERPDPLHAVWADWVGQAWQVCRPAHERGELPLHLGQEYRDRAHDIGHPGATHRWDPALRTRYSDFHRRLLGWDWITPIADDFGPYRFATNVLYSLLVVCGVTAIDRYLAAYLLGEGAQRLAGASWRDSPTGWPPRLAETVTSTGSSR